METLYRKGDILTAIDPCIMEDSKDQALIPGKEYVIFKSIRNTIWINSEIGEHQFEIKELSEFFDEVIKSDNTETLANALRQIEKLEAEKPELQQWKDSALEVMNQINLQEVGKALNLQLGSSVSEQILPSIKKLVADKAELLKALEEVKMGIFQMSFDQLELLYPEIESLIQKMKK